MKYDPRGIGISDAPFACKADVCADAANGYLLEIAKKSQHCLVLVWVFGSGKRGGLRILTNERLWHGFEFSDNKRRRCVLDDV